VQEERYWFDELKTGSKKNKGKAMKIEQERKNVYRKGQSTVEYIILMAVVIALLLVFFRPASEQQGWASGIFQNVLTNVIQRQGQDMLNAARTIF
jgi:hypothetical protein